MQKIILRFFGLKIPNLSKQTTIQSFFNKSFIFPLARPPAAHQDDAANVLIESEANPHADKSIAKRNADDVTHANGDAPIEDDSDDNGIDGIARGP